MKYWISISLIVILSAFSCSKPVCACDPVMENVFEATVKVTSDLSCNKPVLEFDTSAEPNLKKITGKDGVLYVADQLPADLLVDDKKIYVQVRALTSSEDFACLAIGIWYPHIKVVTAWAR